MKLIFLIQEEVRFDLNRPPRITVRAEETWARNSLSIFIRLMSFPPGIADKDMEIDGDLIIFMGVRMELHKHEIAEMNHVDGFFEVPDDAGIHYCPQFFLPGVSRCNNYQLALGADDIR